MHACLSVCENVNVLNSVCCILVKGDFSEGLMHGSGRYVWVDGVVYEVRPNVFMFVLNSECFHVCKTECFQD